VECLAALQLLSYNGWVCLFTQRVKFLWERRRPEVFSQLPFFSPLAPLQPHVFHLPKSPLHSLTHERRPYIFIHIYSQKYLRIALYLNFKVNYIYFLCNSYSTVPMHTDLFFISSKQECEEEKNLKILKTVLN
jgi:hypothetical protein